MTKRVRRISVAVVIADRSRGAQPRADSLDGPFADLATIAQAIDDRRERKAMCELKSGHIYSPTSTWAEAAESFRASIIAWNGLADRGHHLPKDQAHFLRHYVGVGILKLIQEIMDHLARQDRLVEHLRQHFHQVRPREHGADCHVKSEVALGSPLWISFSHAWRRNASAR